MKAVVLKPKRSRRPRSYIQTLVYVAAILFLFNILSAVKADTPAADNIYLESIVEWNPQPAGSSRASWPGMTDENRMPIRSDRGLGPPTGLGAYTSGGGSICVGVGGSAAWKFETGYYICDGQGDDFITFQNNFAWSGLADGLCNELGRVEVSEDAVTWYYNSAERYVENPSPDQNNDDYSYFEVSGLHGGNPTWANHLQDIQAQELRQVQMGEQLVWKWMDITGVMVSKDFKPTDPYLGGDGFDLADFRSKLDDAPWPALGRMKYLRIIDDNTILDGQDYSKAWQLGAHLNAALAIHVMQETPGDRNGPYSSWGQETRTNIPDPGIPGYVGPDGDGRISENNRINPVFSSWAAGYLNYNPTSGCGEAWRTPQKAMGPVTGDDSDAVSLGDLDQDQIGLWKADPKNHPGPGEITFTFAAPIANGTGADFAVFENGSEDGSEQLLFSELAYVEVSTDGETFVRFPSRFYAAQSPVGPLGNLDATYVHNLLGKHANTQNDCWGTPFDLEDLKAHEKVISGDVNLDRINFIRVIDIPGDGSFKDSLGASIYDPWLTSGAAGVDIEAVGVIHHSAFISILQVCVGLETDPPIGSGLDQNGDGRAGLAEAIGQLQRKAGVR